MTWPLNPHTKRNHKMQTKIRGSFPGHVQPAPKVREYTPANIEAITKTQAPYTPARPDQGSKWAALFEGVKPGDCFETPPAETARTERALRVYLSKLGYTSRDYVIRRRSTCEDGMGRVWVVKMYAPMKAAA